MRVLSLGGGVQSTTLLLMAITEQIEPLDAAIFADTGWEPAAVYEHMDWLRGKCERAGLSAPDGERGQSADGCAGADCERAERRSVAVPPCGGGP